MFALLENLFNYNFMPHGYCYAWTQKLIGLNVLSGFFTALAYFSVSAAIIYFAQGRNDLPAKTKHLLIGTFLVFLVCGTTHVMGVVTIWYPVYWLQGTIQAINAVISLYVFMFLLVPLIPIAIDAPSPEKLAQMNRALQDEIIERKYSEEQLRLSKAKLEEKTYQLSRANQEIIALNELLKSENLRMSTELYIAQRLQKMILPKDSELQQIEELEIVGFMEPAEEVGGDYYDILQDDGHIKISIGDVTGHGLESGILMLMVQTIVRTLLSYHVTDLKTFVNVLNTTLYKNIHRMDLDKNLTFSFLDYEKGKLSLSGQHEEVLVIRHDGKIERINTVELGFLLGVKMDITHLIGQQEIILEPGDGIVLYTDGITEARNIEGEFYGVDQLSKIVSQHWHLPVTDIQQIVMKDLYRYIGSEKLSDDATLVIVRRKFDSGN